MSKIKSVREHLADIHKQAGAFHGGMSKCHGNLSECYGTMSKAAGNDDGKMYAKLQAEHSKMSDLHGTAAEYHSSCEKSMTDSLEKIVPDNVRAIIPSDVPVTPVPRNGQPAFGKAVDTTNVPLNFQHLVQVSDSPD